MQKKVKWYTIILSPINLHHSLSHRNRQWEWLIVFFFSLHISYIIIDWIDTCSLNENVKLLVFRRSTWIKIPLPVSILTLNLKLRPAELAVDCFSCTGLKLFTVFTPFPPSKKQTTTTNKQHKYNTNHTNNKKHQQHKQKSTKSICVIDWAAYLALVDHNIQDLLMNNTFFQCFCIRSLQSYFCRQTN